MERKTKYLIIALCCIIGIVLGTTTAWYTWTSSTNTDVTFNIGGLTITYEAGDDITGQNLRPTMSKEIGVTNNYAIKKDITVSANKKAYLSLYLTANELPTELRHESFTWELYENISDNEILLSSGNFKDVIEGDRILLVGNTKTDDYIRDLTLYIYIDGTMSNPSSMGGQSYNFTLNAEATEEKGEYQINIPHTRISDSTPGVLSGSGTEEEPYLIESIEDLITLSNNVNSGTTYEGKYMSLKQTLDFNSDESYVDSTNTTLFGDYNGDGTVTSIKEEVTTRQGFIPIGLGTYLTDGTSISGYQFKGTFLGNNNVVKNLYINYDSSLNYNTHFFGLFGYIKSAEVEDLSVTGNINVLVDSNKFNVGGIVGIVDSSKIINSNNYVNINVTNNGNFAVRTGGIAGYLLANSEVSNCVNHESVVLTGSIVGQLNMGGVVADVSSGTVTKSYNYGNFIGDSQTNLAIGGIVGYNKSEIKNSENYGNIELKTNSVEQAEHFIGGISGYNYGGSLDGDKNYGKIKYDSLNHSVIIGGITGDVNSGTVSNSYNTGKISGNSGTQELMLGDLIGNVKNAPIVTNSYYLNNIEALYGYTDGTAITITNSMSKTESEMKSSAFVDLLNTDLSEPVWVMDTEGINDGYPILSFQR